MASRAIISEILERKLGYIPFAPRAEQLAAIVDDYAAEFRGTDAELLASGVDQWFRNQPKDKPVQSLPRPAQIWPLINRDRTEQRISPDNAAARFVPIPEHVKQQRAMLATAWSMDHKLDPRTREHDPEKCQRCVIAGQIKALAPTDIEAGTRACRCVGGWIYEGGQTFPADGLLCDRRVYPCKVHAPKTFDTWLQGEHDS